MPKHFRSVTGCTPARQGLVILHGDVPPYASRPLMTHEVFTIVAPIRDRAASTHLKQILAEINANPSGNALLPFGKLPMVHFASFVVFSDPVQELSAPPLLDHLVFESCIDGPFDEPTSKRSSTWGCRRFTSCSRAAEATTTVCLRMTASRAYIVAKRRKPHLLHIGSPGLRVDHIKAGDSLRRVLDRELDDVVKRGRSTDRPLDLMRALRASLNVPPSTRDHWFLQEADSHARPSNGASPGLPISSRTSARSSGTGASSSCSALSAIRGRVVERLMALESWRGTFDRVALVGLVVVASALLALADERKAVARATAKQRSRS